MKTYRQRTYVDTDKSVHHRCALGSLFVTVEPIAGGSLFAACYIDVLCMHWRSLAIGIDHLKAHCMDAGTQVLGVDGNHACCLRSRPYRFRVVVEPVTDRCACSRRNNKVLCVHCAPLVSRIKCLNVQGMELSFRQHADVEFHGCLALSRALSQGGEVVVEPIAVTIGRLSPCRAYQGKEHD